jgi:hypothetical protein
MRTLLVQSGAEILGSSCLPGAVPHHVQDKASFVQLEIQVDALQRLLTERKLVIEEMHCLNKKSKNVIRKILLNNLVAISN